MGWLIFLFVFDLAIIYLTFHLKLFPGNMVAQNPIKFFIQILAFLYFYQLFFIYLSFILFHYLLQF